ncbi:MAG: restriction endonuclease subunit S [Streptosporangiaceae bacterium]
MNELPSGWVRVPLGQVAASQLGRMLSANRETGDHPKPYLRNRDVQWGHINVDELPVMDFGPNDAARFLLCPDDVLVCEGGEVGRAAIWSGQLSECYYQKALHRVRTSPALLPRVLLYLLEYYARTRAFERYTSGSTIAHLPQEDLRSLPIPIPPVAEQGRIAAAIEEQFSRLDAGIMALRRARQNLKRMRAAVLRAAITGALPSGVSDQTSAVDLLTQILEARQKASGRTGRRYVEPMRPTDSRISIPCHWTFASLDMLAESAEAITDGPFGSNLKSSHYTSCGPRVIRLQNVGDGEFIDVKAHVSDEHYQSLAKHSVKPGDLVCVLLGEVMPRAIIVPSDIGPAIVKADCPRIRVSPLVNRRYVWAALNAPGVRQEVSRRIHGVGRPRLTLKELREVAIPLPPRQEQDAIADVMDRQLEIIDRVGGEIDHWRYKIERLRVAILNAAFSGKLVAQDINDEPASALLEKIAAERASSNGASPVRTRKLHAPQGKAII